MNNSRKKLLATVLSLGAVVAPYNILAKETADIEDYINATTNAVKSVPETKEVVKSDKGDNDILVVSSSPSKDEGNEMRNIVSKEDEVATVGTLEKIAPADPTYLESTLNTTTLNTIYESSEAFTQQKVVFQGPKTVIRGL